jgi:hypothetical protein
VRIGFIIVYDDYAPIAGTTGLITKKKPAGRAPLAKKS